MSFELFMAMMIGFINGKCHALLTNILGAALFTGFYGSVTGFYGSDVY